jgi:hypothetical protein
MKLVTWRTSTCVLAAVCCYQLLHGTTTTTVVEHAPATTTMLRTPCAPDVSSPELAKPTWSWRGFRAPAWATQLAPQPGEKLRDYRDRVLPLALVAIAPQRARVARMRDAFPLDTRQRAELDAAVKDAATAIEQRIATAIADGELRPATFTPMTGVAIARDVLDIVDRGNAQFVTSLGADQRAQLAAHRFDFADYLLFSTHWEDALAVVR